MLFRKVEVPVWDEVRTIYSHSVTYSFLQKTNLRRNGAHQIEYNKAEIVLKQTHTSQLT